MCFNYLFNYIFFNIQLSLYFYSLSIKDNINCFCQAFLFVILSIASTCFIVSMGAHRCVNEFKKAKKSEKGKKFSDTGSRTPILWMKTTYPNRWTISDSHYYTFIWLHIIYIYSYILFLIWHLFIYDQYINYMFIIGFFFMLRVLQRESRRRNAPANKNKDTPNNLQ